MSTTLIKNAIIVNEGKKFPGDVLITDNIITAIYPEGTLPENLCPAVAIDAAGKMLLPGVIDDQVHFRQPGLTHKGDLLTESTAAIAGGVTSIMEMPNTNPVTVTQGLLDAKYEDGARFSLANYSFYMGATNDNLSEILKTDPRNVCGIKVFMGSSTGNMLVDDPSILEGIFKEAPTLVAVHCEDEVTIKADLEKFKQQYGENIPFARHGEIRSAEACFKSTEKAVNLAAKHSTRLHVLHLSTEREMALFSNGIPSSEKKITAEVCVHHLWFNEKAYDEKGAFIKWNPSIKSENDRLALWKALLENKIDVIATDHAPHTLEEKSRPYLTCPSGGPLVQHSLQAMLDFYKKGVISIEKIVEKMSHTPADIFKVSKRGYIRPGYYADLVLVDTNAQYEVSRNNILYKCKWSPFDGHTFASTITHTFINGKLVFENGRVDARHRGMRLQFDR